jgi:hypothetical protein
MTEIQVDHPIARPSFDFRRHPAASIRRLLDRFGGARFFVGAYALLILLTYFPGNLSVFWLYAVEVNPRVGLTSAD